MSVVGFIAGVVLDQAGLGPLGNCVEIAFGLFGSGGSSNATDPREQKLRELVESRDFYEAKRFVNTLGLGYAKEREVLERLERAEAAAVREFRLNSLVSAGAIDEAKNYVRTNMNLSYAEQNEIFGRIEQVGQRAAKVKEAEGKIDERLRDGDVKGALRCLDDLDLPKDTRKKVAESIKAQVRDREKAKKDFESKVKEIERLLQKGNLIEAKRLVETLPIKSEAKQAFLASLGEESARREEAARLERERESMRSQARDREKAQKDFESKVRDIERLLQKGHLFEAKRLIETLPIKPEAKQALLASLRAESAGREEAARLELERSSAFGRQRVAAPRIPSGAGPAAQVGLVTVSPVIEPAALRLVQTMTTWGKRGRLDEAIHVFDEFLKTTEWRLDQRVRANAEDLIRSGAYQAAVELIGTRSRSPR